MLRVLARLRVDVYRRLEPLVPGGLPGGVTSRSGDVLNRLVQDVDSVQDLLLRSVVPALTGAIVVAGTVVVDAWLLPAAGLVLLACLLVAGVAVPWLTSTGRRGRRPPGRPGPRGVDAPTWSTSCTAAPTCSPTALRSSDWPISTGPMTN